MKRFTNDPFVWICLAAALFFCVHFIGNFFEESPSALLQDAQMSYLNAERTKVVTERKQGFNHALEVFLELEKKYSPYFGNGKLFFDIGNTFFQLEDFPNALLYYYRAQLLRPTDEKVKAHIELAKNKLSLPETTKPSVFDWLFYFHRHFSLPERLQLLAFLNCALFALISLNLWLPHRFFYACSMALGVIAALFVLSVSSTYLFSPHEGVIINSSVLYRDAGTHYAKVKPDPLPAGIKVVLQGTALGGKWVKIATNDGTVGFLPQETLRAISN